MTTLFYSPAEPGHIKIERQKARELRATSWWKQKLDLGVCHYCELKVLREDLTMDHIVPLGRGGMSIKGNIVASCKECNSKKQSKTAAEMVLDAISEKSLSEESQS